MNLNNFLVDSASPPGPWQMFEFPNGHSATVQSDETGHDLHTWFRFKMESTHPDDIADYPHPTVPGTALMHGLDTIQVRAKLHALTHLPRNDWND